jgi:hypothetical protein
VASQHEVSKIIPFRPRQTPAARFPKRLLVIVLALLLAGQAVQTGWALLSPPTAGSGVRGAPAPTLLDGLVLPAEARYWIPL